MPSDINEVLIIIQSLRDKLEQIIDDKGLDDPQVLTASHMLDAVLSEYYKLFKEKE